MAMRRPSSDKPDAGILPKGGPSILESIYPVLWEFLTEELWEDGARRELPTMLFFREAGMWKVCLSDKALDRVVFVAGHTPDDVIETLSVRLETDSLEWRAKKPFVPTKKKS